MERLQVHGRYLDRRDAGQVLADLLARQPDDPDRIIYAIPRGGVVVGFELAHSLKAPLDIVAVRKLGHPWQPELAIGAIGPGGVRIVNRDFGLPDAIVDLIADRETKEMRRRERSYRAGRPPIDPAGRAAIVVDDGLATGFTMRAAIASLRARHARRIVVAVPVGPRATYDELVALCDRLICPVRPLELVAVGEWYERFEQTSDAEVRRLLALADQGLHAAAS